MQEVKTQPKPQPLLYDLHQAAALLGVSRATLYRAEKARKLRFTRFMGRTMVSAEEIARIAREGAEAA